MGKKRTPFVIDREGTCLYVDWQRAGISTLVVLIDGLPLTRFGDEEKAYLKVTDAIAWHEKELKDSNGTSGSQKTLEVLKQAQAKFLAGQVVETTRR